jgi:hypothetical protein
MWKGERKEEGRKRGREGGGRCKYTFKMGRVELKKKEGRRKKEKRKDPRW